MRCTRRQRHARVLGGDAGIVTCKGQVGRGRPAASSCSDASRGALPGPATLPSMWGTAAAEGSAATAAAVVVRYSQVRAPRFEPCRCGMSLRTILSPVKEIVPDRRTPEYERMLAEFGTLLPYRSARSLLGTF